MTQKDCTSVSLELHVVFDPLMLLSFQVSHIASGLLSDV